MSFDLFADEVYSINSRMSFQDIRNYYEEIFRVKRDWLPMQIPMVLVGLKSDLEDIREVPSEEGLALAAKMGIPFLEASAKSGWNLTILPLPLSWPIIC